MKTNYELLTKQLISLCENESDLVANLANCSAAIKQAMEDINWVGFYLLKENELVLGPFQGNVACVRIPLNRGVCGKCVSTQATIRVADVHQFEGHIACDCASNSEIVLPLIKNNQVVGVLDIDSPCLDRFSIDDEIGLTQVKQVIEKLFA